MPSDLENSLALVALRERQKFLERGQRELERIILDFLHLAAGRPGREVAYGMPTDRSDPLWVEATAMGERVLKRLGKTEEEAK